MVGPHTVISKLSLLIAALTDRCKIKINIRVVGTLITSTANYLKLRMAIDTMTSTRTYTLLALEFVGLFNFSKKYLY